MLNPSQIVFTSDNIQLLQLLDIITNSYLLNIAKLHVLTMQVDIFPIALLSSEGLLTIVNDHLHHLIEKGLCVQIVVVSY